MPTAAELGLAFADNPTLRAKWKLLLDAPYKSGKTSVGCSLVRYLMNPPTHETEPGLGLAPEECFIGFIDNDDGVGPIMDGMNIPKEWRSRIMLPSPPTSSWTELVLRTEYMIQYAQEHARKAKHPEATWLVVDSTEFAWVWARDDFAQKAYDQSEGERMQAQRIEARKQGQKTLPTFNPNFDYGAINMRYGSEWADKIKLSGINFVLMSPTKTGTEKKWDPITKKHGEEVPYIRAGGQKHDEGRVDFLVRMYGTGAEMRTFEIIGGRFPEGISPPAKRFPNPNMSRILRCISKIQSGELK